MKIKEKHIEDFLLGFFFIPFLLFIFYTTIKLISSPELISDGMAIIYVALITGMYYVFSKDKKSAIVFIEEPVFSLAKTLGMAVFILCKLFLF